MTMRGSTSGENLAVLLDALEVGRLDVVSQLVTTAGEREALKCCDGDEEGLIAALGSRFVRVFSDVDDGGYGHHSCDEVFVTDDGRIIHAECGGCSCEGSGSWSEVPSLEEAMRLVPYWKRS
jgi:hypothetical protein